MSGYVSQEEFQNKCKGMEDRLVYRMERECERVKKAVEMSVQELGQSMVDCLKRRDVQLEAKFKSLNPISTPVTSKICCGAHDSGQGQNHTFEVQQSSFNSQEKTMLMPYSPPVKLDFPCFSNNQDEDPILFIERCEEYFAVRPLSDQKFWHLLTQCLRKLLKTGGKPREGRYIVGGSLKMFFYDRF